MDINQVIKVDLNRLVDVKSFIVLTNRQKYRISAQSGDYKVDAKSIMGLLSLDLSSPVTIVLHTEDTNEINKFSKYIVK